MYLQKIQIANHPFLKNIDINLVNPFTGKPYSIIAFVGENGCGKTTILKELFNYNDSKYLQKSNKNTIKVLFLRQGSLHNNAMREVRKLIDASDIYTPRNNQGISDSKMLDNSIVINDSEQGLSLIKTLGDDAIYELFEKNHIDDVYCSQEESKVIDGKTHGFDITNYSSGQQEILLKLKDIKLMSTGTDCLLLDEPETSLHPRWQLDIVKLIRMMTKDKQGNYPQLFLATHSDKILRSILKHENSLVVRLYRDTNNEVRYETISEMDMVLPRLSIAELNFLIFKEESLEYCSELYDLLEWMIEKSSFAIDKHIRHTKFYDENIHYKEWYNEKYNDVTSYTMPLYCRNYFHHPKNKKEPTEKELHDAIELLRNVIKDLKTE